MNRFAKGVAAMATGCAALLAGGEAHAGICKLVINVDLTGSMMALRDDGFSKCRMAQTSAMAAMEWFRVGKDFDVTQPMSGPVDRVEYDTNCPSQAERVMDVRVFHGDTMASLTGGFQPVEIAYQLAVDSGQIVNPATLIATENCPGAWTPMAQSMCRAARAFSAAPTAPPIGEVRVVKTTTDGQENRSDVVPVVGAEARCRLPGDTEEQWRDRVEAEYLARGIISDAILWEVGGSTSGLVAKLMKQETQPTNYEPQAGPVRKGDVGPATAGEVRAADDASFFAGLAAQVPGGRYKFVAHTRVLSPMITLADGDSDGVPDFRDACAGACANDADADQIPSPTDVCSTAPEDARGLNKTDGCPDTDSDGLRNGLDLCPTVAEDGRPPFRTDGCRAANFSASAQPALKTVDNAQVCTSLNVATRSDSALAKLDLSGSHSWRSALSGTLSHNGVTVAAFPIGTFPGGSGTFTFSGRPVAGLSGDTQGTWTLCLRDNDAFGDTGVLSAWSVHN
jgi:hypothetical protein